MQQWPDMPLGMLVTLYRCRLYVIDFDRGLPTRHDVQVGCSGNVAPIQADVVCTGDFPRLASCSQHIECWVAAIYQANLAKHQETALRLLLLQNCSVLLALGHSGHCREAR
jgi:hypothetical protein